MAGVLAIAVTTMMSACGSGLPATTPSNLHSAAATPAPSEADSVSVRLAREGRLFCPFSDECHPSVAMISLAVRNGVERCTGFLISPSEVVTSGHCFSSIESSETVHGKAFVHFAATASLEAETFGVDAIQARSRSNELASQDYAILHLEKPADRRSPIRVSQRGFDPNEAAQVFRVQPNDRDGRRDGFQSKLDCEATFETILYPAVRSKNSPLFTFAGCKLESGNSGAPVLNANGEAVAIAQGYLSLKPEFVTRLSFSESDASSALVAVATQLRCLPKWNEGNREGCEAVSALPTSWSARVLSQNPVLPHVNASLHWKGVQLKQVSESRFFALLPKCIAQQSPNRIRSMLVSYRAFLNKKLQLEWRSEIEPGEKTLEWTIEVKAQRASLTHPELDEVDLPLCDE